jgi:hypothetical protein
MRNWIERVIQRKSFPFIIEIFDDPDIKKAITIDRLYELLISRLDRDPAIVRTIEAPHGLGF